jgi:hypothetical protein
MKDFIFTLFGVSLLGVVTNEDIGTWERLLEKWGIGLVGLVFFCVLAWWTAKRDEKDKVDRIRKEDANQEERKALLSENNDLQKAQIAMMEKHAQRIEQLTKEANRSRDDHSAALRMMFRKMSGLPCVGKIERQDVEDLIQANNRKIEEANET